MLTALVQPISLIINRLSFKGLSLPMWRSLEMEKSHMMRGHTLEWNSRNFCFLVMEGGTINSL